MLSVDDGTDRAARAELELAPALPSREGRRPKGQPVGGALHIERRY